MHCLFRHDTSTRFYRQKYTSSGNSECSEISPLTRCREPFCLAVFDINSLDIERGLSVQTRRSFERPFCRGCPASGLQGAALYRVNAELRTKGLNLWTVHVGAVVFYDGGDAPRSLSGFLRDGTFVESRYRQDVGFGLRLGLPQFNREVVRIDLGFPLELPSSGGMYAPRFSAEFGQAF